MIATNFDYWNLSSILGCTDMLNGEKEAKIAEIFLTAFDEKSPLDYDILDSMFQESKIIADLAEK